MKLTDFNILEGWAGLDYRIEFWIGAHKLYTYNDFKTPLEAENFIRDFLL